MSTEEAFEIVYEMASQNIIEADELPEEHKRQFEALAIVHDFIMNNILR